MLQFFFDVSESAQCTCQAFFFFSVLGRGPWQQWRIGAELVKHIAYLIFDISVLQDVLKRQKKNSVHELPYGIIFGLSRVSYNDALPSCVNLGSNAQLVNVPKEKVKTLIGRL